MGRRKQETVRKRILLASLLGSLAVSSPALAHDTETAFPTRGACESASAAMSNDERDWVLASFPDLFRSGGDVSSFLTKAFTCDRNPSDGQWYISDHIADVLGSDWYLHRH